MKELGKALIALAAFISFGALAQTGSPPTPDLLFNAWYMGLPVHTNSMVAQSRGGNGPEAPTAERADLKIYQTGHIDLANPRSLPRDMWIPAGPGGSMVLLPAHDNTVKEFVPWWDWRDGFGYFVIPGPNATVNNVRTRPMPQHSLVGAPLAYEIKLAGVWAPLNSHITIEKGLQLGLLKLRPFHETPIDVFWITWDIEALSQMAN